MDHLYSLMISSTCTGGIAGSPLTLPNHKVFAKLLNPLNYVGKGEIIASKGQLQKTSGSYAQNTMRTFLPV